ncbi:hypothetical protein [Pelagerythrobacter sp.]|uniref:hypothetical protein n=1 Tax=Pelagerythrobacter sp. TaxID=2800702 RepID=UPI0035B4AEE3
MLIGHWSAAFVAAAAHKRAPKLGTLFIAAQLVDWGFFALAMVGVERLRIEPGATAMNPLDLYHMPYTHSLAGSAIWALAFALILLVWRRDLLTAAIGGAVVMSHWFLDLLFHRPDLTLAGEAPYLGFGLWNHPAIAMPLETGLVLAAFALYVRRTKGPVAPPLILIALLLALQAINWFGPPPESAGPILYLSVLAAFGVATWAAYWTGNTRWHRREVGLAVPTWRR